jgi:hypothetical protein
MDTEKRDLYLRIAELADAYNRLCAENADFVAESIKADRRIAELESEVMEFRSRGNVAMSSWDEERERALREGERVVSLEAECKTLRRDAERWRALKVEPTQTIGGNDPEYLAEVFWRDRRKK